MHAPQWQEIELALTTTGPLVDGYLGPDVTVRFTHASGTTLSRPAFWDGDSTYCVRFASPLAQGTWYWQVQSELPFLEAAGELNACASSGGTDFGQHGLLAMSPSKRNAIHADGTPFLVVADTGWSIPFRATHEECREYAAFRAAQGFNAVLLMSIQPDRDAIGPRDRTALDGFAVAFEDLPQGHLREINLDYFQYLDGLSQILADAGIAAIWQPVFHGYGWKGGRTAGNGLVREEYARFCRYLVARYGARPALYLINGDGPGYVDSVDLAGQAVHDADCYGQPTGNHYGPHCDNRAWQEREWLDFQLCQTGHAGEHRPDKVAAMWCERPIKAVANGEPTYERMGDPDKAAGWWQGHEAWVNLCAGGTFGVFYGAGSLWNWRHTRDETHTDWCVAANCNWRDALHFDGAGYVGLVGKLLHGYPFAEMAPTDSYSYGLRCLAVPDRFALFYVERGGHLNIASRQCPRAYRIVDPRNGEELGSGCMAPDAKSIDLLGTAPRLVLLTV